MLPHGNERELIVIDVGNHQPNTPYLTTSAGNDTIFTATGNDEFLTRSTEQRATTLSSKRTTHPATLYDGFDGSPTHERRNEHSAKAPVSDRLMTADGGNNRHTMSATSTTNRDHRFRPKLLLEIVCKISIEIRAILQAPTVERAMSNSLS